jgi:hypothetical protein
MQTAHWTAAIGVASAALVGMVQAASMSSTGRPASVAEPTPLAAAHMLMVQEARTVETAHEFWRGR